MKTSTEIPKTIAKKVAETNKLIDDLRKLKKEYPKYAWVVSTETGSILNGYREGDISFSDAVNMIEKRGLNRSIKTNAKEIENLIIDAMGIEKKRVAMWNFLYRTEFSSQSVKLNEVMATMTDEELWKWFPKIFAEFLSKRVGVS